MTNYYVAYDSAGIIVTRYDSDINAAQIANPQAGITLLEVTRSEMLETVTGGWTVVNGKLVAPPAPTAAQILAQAQSAQIALVTQGYEAAIAAPVTYKTAAGVTAMFSTDAKAVSYLQSVIAAGEAAWTANLWLDSSGKPVTPFTFADVQGLAEAIENAETPEYQELLKLIGEINAATTVSAVRAIVWP